MKKYLVDVYLPSLGKHYDVYLPISKTIGEATGLLAKIAESITNGGYKCTEHTLLLNADNGSPFNRDISVYDAGIRNSSMLILI